MKKYLLAIITILSFFSIANTTIAANIDDMETFFNIEYNAENTRLQYGFTTVDTVYFKNPEMRIRLNKFQRADQQLKDSFIKKYENGEISRYGMDDLVRNYNYYTYHINKLFYYQSIKEVSTDYRELDNAIINSSMKARSYYNNVKNVLEREKKKQKTENLFDLYK